MSGEIISSQSISGVSQINEVSLYLDLFSQLLNHSKAMERNEIDRLAIQKTSEENILRISKEMDLLEKKLLSDESNLREFVENSWKRIDELIEREQFELADRFHQRISSKFEGRVKRTIERINDSSADSSFLLSE